MHCGPAIHPRMRDSQAYEGPTGMHPPDPRNRSPAP
jgi:hypothetical protein